MTNMHTVESWGFSHAQALVIFDTNTQADWAIQGNAIWAETGRIEQASTCGNVRSAVPIIVSRAMSNLSSLVGLIQSRQRLSPVSQEMDELLTRAVARRGRPE